MSEVVGEGIIQIRTDESGVDYDGAGKRAGGGFSKGFGGAIKGLAGVIGGVLAAKAVVGVLGDAVGEAREAQKVGAASEQIIKATGQAAGVTAGQVGDMAGRLSSVSGIDDEVIQQGANLLLTFKNVKNYVDGEFVGTFDRATAAAVDLSAAGFGSVEGSSKMLGKALNDPLKGISALGRAGVTFTAQQQEQIKSLVEGGDAAKAQALILAEVESQVGGVAAATATSGEKAKVAFGNIYESIGTLLLPILDTLANYFVGTLAPAIQTGIGFLSGLQPVFQSIGDTIGSVFSGGGGPGGAMTAFFANLQAVAAAVFPIVVGFVTGTLIPAFQTIGAVIVNDVLPVISTLATLFVANVLPAMQSLFGAIQVGVAEILPVVVAFFVGTLLPTFQRLATIVYTQVVPAVAGFASVFVSQVLPVIIKVVAFVAGNLVPILATVISVVLRVIAVVLNLVTGFIQVIGKVGGFASALTDLISNGLNAVFNAVKELPGRLLALGGRFLEVGQAIIGKFVDGLKGAGGLVSDIAGNIWDAVRGLLNDAINKINAALEFTINLPGPDITINPPNIPALAGGGLVTRPTVSLTGEAGAEGVIPLTRPAALRPIIDALDAARSGGSGSGGQPIEVHVHSPMDDPEGTALRVVDRIVAAIQV